MKARVGINGFGRIGRQMFRIAMKRKDIEIVAINNLSDNTTLAHLLKYDSSYGTLEAEVKTDGPGYIVVDGKKIRYFQEKDPAKIPWGEEKVDIVLEATGVFNDAESGGKHMRDTVKKVIFTAAAKGADFTVCLGVNEDQYDPAKHSLISNASCTTNCMAPIVKVLHENLKIQQGMMTTVHSYTNDQNILDLPHKDLRRARAAAVNIIPTTTNAATAVTVVIPELKGKLNGLSIRVPTPTVSILDFVCVTEKSTSVEEVNAILKKAAESKELKGILAYNELQLVSNDYKGDVHSSIVDGLNTMVIEGNMVKVLAWYDNEWGYSCRVVDLAEIVARKM
ncbi:MAG: type I glyceraldehyde-3-phosphate dehydrogenase [Candidatus Gracilibacteria bacterium]